MVLIKGQNREGMGKLLNDRYRFKFYKTGVIKIAASDCCKI